MSSQRDLVSRALLARPFERLVLVLAAAVAFQEPRMAQVVTGSGSVGPVGRQTFAPRSWVVDASGGGNFLDLPPAVAAARDGDLILVRDGSYSALVLDDLGVTVLAEGTAVSIVGRSSVTNLPVGEDVVLKGLGFLEASSGLPVLTVADSVGVVWMEDVSVATTTTGIALQDAAGVVLVRTEVVPSGLAFCTSGVAALEVLRSDVHAFETRFLGADNVCFGTSPGVTGAMVEDGFLYAASSSFEGGTGSASFCMLTSSVCTFGAGVGGDGLVVIGASQAVELESTFLAGANGTVDSTCSLCGAGGIPSNVVGPLTSLSGPARMHTAESPVRGGGAYLLRAEGLDGDTVFSLYADAATPVYVPALLGPMLVEDPPLLAWLEGVLPASGILENTYPVPPLLYAYERLFVQGLFLDSALQEHLAGGTALYVLP